MGSMMANRWDPSKKRKFCCLRPTKKKCSTHFLIMQELYNFCLVIWNNNAILGSQDTLRIGERIRDQLLGSFFFNAPSKKTLITSPNVCRIHVFLTWYLPLRTQPVFTHSFTKFVSWKIQSSSLILTYFAEWLIRVHMEERVVL